MRVNDIAVVEYPTKPSGFKVVRVVNYLAMLGGAAARCWVIQESGPNQKQWCQQGNQGSLVA